MVTKLGPNRAPRMEMKFPSCIGRAGCPNSLPRPAFSACKPLKIGLKSGDRQEQEDAQTRGSRLPVTGTPKSMGIFDPIGTPGPLWGRHISSEIVTAFSHWAGRSIPGYLAHFTKNSNSSKFVSSLYRPFAITKTASKCQRSKSAVPRLACRFEPLSSVRAYIHRRSACQQQSPC
jgi:hypothetical protein